MEIEEMTQGMFPLSEKQRKLLSISTGELRCIDCPLGSRNNGFGTMCYNLPLPHNSCMEDRQEALRLDDEFRKDLSSHGVFTPVPSKTGLCDPPKKNERFAASLNERHFSAALDLIKELEARLEQYESEVERVDTPEEAEKKRDDLALKELKSGKVVEYYEHDFGTHACFAVDVEDKNNKDESYSEEFPYVDLSKPVTGDLLVHVDADTCFIFDRAEDGVYYAKTGLGYKPECFKKTGFFIDEDGLPKRRVL